MLVESRRVPALQPHKASGRAVVKLGDRVVDLGPYRPRDHKVERHGMDRVIPLGPKAQAVLAPFLSLDPLAALFSPKVAEMERRAAMRAARKTKVWPSHSKMCRHFVNSLDHRRTRTPRGTDDGRMPNDAGSVPCNSWGFAAFETGSNSGSGKYPTCQ